MDRDAYTTRDLLGLSIDASHSLTLLAQRAEELEDLVVKLASTLSGTGQLGYLLDLGQLELLEIARYGHDMRRRARNARHLPEGQTSPAALEAVPDQT